MTTPFGRLGGKSKIANQLISYFPDNYNLYVEPFVGAGNVFFRLSEEKKTNPMIINDLDEDVFIALKGLQENSNYINDNIRRIGISSEEWNKLKDKKDALSIIEKLKWSFLSKGKHYNPSIYKKKNKTNYSKFGLLLKNTTILNDDYKKIIAEYDSKDTFFYLDPPYEGSNVGYYKHHSFNPIEIRDILRNIKGRFIMSFNDNENIRNIFKDFYLYNIQTKYEINHLKTGKNHREKTELIISNYSFK